MNQVRSLPGLQESGLAINVQAFGLMCPLGLRSCSHDRHIHRRAKHRDCLLVPPPSGVERGSGDGSPAPNGNRHSCQCSRPFLRRPSSHGPETPAEWGVSGRKAPDRHRRGAVHLPRTHLLPMRRSILSQSFPAHATGAWY